MSCFYLHATIEQEVNQEYVFMRLSKLPENSESIQMPLFFQIHQMYLALLC